MVEISNIVIVILEYRIDLSRLDVIEFDNNNSINELNNIAKNREIRTPTSMYTFSTFSFDYNNKKNINLLLVCFHYS